MTQTFSLRKGISSLPSSDTVIEPTDPTFPYNLSTDNKKLFHMNMRKIIDAQNSDTQPFSEPTSLRIQTQHFREFFPSLPSKRVYAHMAVLTSDLKVSPMYDVVTDQYLRERTIQEGMVLVFLTFDRVTSVANCAFLRVTNTGFVRADDQVTSFVNVERIVSAIDTPERTNVTWDDEALATDENTTKVLAALWAMLSSISLPDHTATLEQHLYRKGPFDLDAFFEKNKETHQFITETCTPSSLLSYLYRIAERRNEILASIKKRRGGLELAVKLSWTDEGEATLQITTLPTNFLKARVATLEVKLSIDEMRYLSTVEPALAELGRDEVVRMVAYYNPLTSKA